MAESTSGVGTARLAWKIFFVALIALALAVGAWALVRWNLAPEPDQPAVAAVSRGWTAFNTAREDRYERLALASRVLAREDALVQVLASGATSAGATGTSDTVTTDTGTGDTGAQPGAAAAEGGAAASGSAALADLLAQRRDELGYDFALVLDADGRVLAATEGAEEVGADLASRGVVGRGLEDGSARGAWARRDGRLALAALEWVAPDFELMGYVVTGLDLDDVLALQLQRTSGAEVAFLAPVAGSDPDAVPRGRAVGSSMEAALAQRLAAELAGDGGLLDADTPREGVQVELSGTSGASSFEALLAPLEEAGGRAVGAVVVASPLATSSDAGALPWLAGGLAVALFAAFLLALLVARSVLAPVERLTTMVRTAPQEGFARRPEARRAGHLAPLATALRRLFRDLQEERTLAATAAATAAAAGDPGGSAPEPRLDKTTLVGVDLRRYARLGGASSEVRDTADRLARDETRVRSLVAAHGGRLAGGAGHRMLATFDGDDGTWEAVAAAAAILHALGARESAFDEGEPPAVAVARGRVAHGAGAAGRPFLVGPAVQLVESLLREAGPGELLMARPVHRDVADRLEAAGAPARETRGVLSPQPLFALGRQQVEPWIGALEDADTATPVPGEVLQGRFEILADRGGSSAGPLFLARDREMDREVALKRLRPRRDDSGRDGVLAAVRRFSHPHVAEVHALRPAGTAIAPAGEALSLGDDPETLGDEPRGGAAGTAAGVRRRGAVLLAREWVAGAPLVIGRDLPLPATLGLARQVAAALAAIHGAGLVHGRLKPENVILVPGAGVRLTDLGVGSLVGSSLSASADERLLAPEQAMDRLGDARSDVFAFGALIARLASGRWWTGEGAVASDGPEEHGGAGLPDELVALLRRCLAPTPEARPTDGAEVLDALAGVTS